MSLDNESPCPGCGIPIGDHTIRGYEECLKRSGFNYELPVEEIPGGPVSYPSHEGSMVGEITVMSAVLDTAMGVLPVLRFVFTAPGATPMSRVNLPPIDLVMDAAGLRRVKKLVGDSVELAIKAARR